VEHLEYVYYNTYNSELTICIALQIIVFPNDEVHHSEVLQLVSVDALGGGQGLAVLGELLRLVRLVLVSMI
jgi:hypothetical protein